MVPVWVGGAGKVKDIFLAGAKVSYGGKKKTVNGSNDLGMKICDKNTVDRRAISSCEILNFLSEQLTAQHPLYISCIQHVHSKSFNI